LKPAGHPRPDSSIFSSVRCSISTDIQKCFKTDAEDDITLMMLFHKAELGASLAAKQRFDKYTADFRKGSPP